MVVKLNKPLSTHQLTDASIAAVKVESNPCAGRQWIDIYITVGYLQDPEDPDSYVEQVNPDTGDRATHVRIENGIHPLLSKSCVALGRCEKCGNWYKQTNGICVCGGNIRAYDGWDRLTKINDAYEKFQQSLYEFLCEEEVCDPVDLKRVVKLLDAKLTKG